MQVINDLLEYQNMKIYQDTDMFSFSLDSVLLANFVTLNKNVKKVLDIGCGNAVIPLIVSTKTDAKIIGIEIQKEVFNLAVKSVLLNKKENQIQIINADINNYYINEITEKYDTITCNPPFFKICEGSKMNNSSYKTVARHEVKLDLESLIKIAKKLLKNNGNIAIVHRTQRLVDIITLMRENNIEPKRIQFVYSKENKDSNILLKEFYEYIKYKVIIDYDDYNLIKEKLNILVTILNEEKTMFI